MGAGWSGLRDRASKEGRAQNQQAARSRSKLHVLLRCLDTRQQAHGPASDEVALLLDQFGRCLAGEGGDVFCRLLQSRQRQILLGVAAREIVQHGNQRGHVTRRTQPAPFTVCATTSKLLLHLVLEWLWGRRGRLHGCLTPWGWRGWATATGRVREPHSIPHR